MSENAADRPNVVVVLCDEMRASAMSCAGDPNVETPNLDALADSGVRFSNAYATSPVCVPSRFSMLTGEYPHSRGVPGIGYRLSPAERTVGKELGELGYETAYVGKWHLHGTTVGGDTRRACRLPIPAAYRDGFDHWRGFELRNDFYDTYYFADDDPEPIPIEGHQTDGLFDVGLDLLDEQLSEDPFFLVLSVEAPHPPHVAPEEYHERWQDRSLELLPNVDPDGEDAAGGRSWTDSYEAFGSPEESRGDLDETDSYLRDALLDDLRGYYAQIEHLDDNVGRLVDALERQGLREETIVVFLSDHGEMLGSHGSRGKSQPHAASAGIPFIVSGPGVETGTVIDEPAATLDLFPTLAGLAGGSDTGEKPGENLVPLLRGRADALDRDGVLLEFFRETRPYMTFHDRPWRALCTERYTYAVIDGDGRGEPWLLFDHAEDPHETTNLVDDPAYRDAAADLHGSLRRRLADADDTYPLAAAYGHDPLNLG